MPEPASALSRAVAPVVRSLVETVICEELGRESLDGVPHVEEAGEVVLHKLVHMPEHLALGMQAMSLLFDATGGFGGGGRFRDQPLARRRAGLARMRRAPVGLLRDFAFFYEKMGAFAWYSLLEEAHGALPAAEGR
jgi:hypothetical protein